MPEEPRRPQKEAEDKDNSKVMNGRADVTLAMGDKEYRAVPAMVLGEVTVRAEEGCGGGAESEMGSGEDKEKEKSGHQGQEGLVGRSE
jgi:putative sterol carrier protein